jgi:hypothetical protein
VTEAQSGVEARLRGLLHLGEGAAGRSLGALRQGLDVFGGRARKEPTSRTRSKKPGRSARSRSAKR